MSTSFGWQPLFVCPILFVIILTVKSEKSLDVFIKNDNPYKIGDTATLTCTGCTDIEKCIFIWSSTNVEVRRTMEENASTCIIPSVSREMEGAPITCEIQEGDDSGKIEIFLKITFENLKVSIEGGNKTYKAGQPVTLTCKGNKTTDAEFTWRILTATPLDNEYLWDGMETQVMSTESVRADQNGTKIQCTIDENKNVSGSASFYLKVLGKLLDVFIKNDNPYKIGDTATLTCTGCIDKEKCIFSWSSTNDEVRRMMETNASTCIIPSVSREMEGAHITCEIQAGDDWGKKEIILKIKSDDDKKKFLAFLLLLLLLVPIGIYCYKQRCIHNQYDNPNRGSDGQSMANVSGNAGRPENAGLLENADRHGNADRPGNADHLGNADHPGNADHFGNANRPGNNNPPVNNQNHGG